MAGITTMGGLRAVFIFAADEGLAHGRYAIAMEHVVQHNKAVQFYFRDRLLLVCHHSALPRTVCLGFTKAFECRAV